jgi:hypothetical protein
MLNAFSLRVVCRQLVLWAVLVGAVVLLTLLFTVLGTITCAVLTGMMMASVGHRRWQTVPVSLVFPGVVVAMIHLAKVELAGARRVVLPVLCFGAFWLSYGMTLLLARYERRVRAASAASTSSPHRSASQTPREKPLALTEPDSTPLHEPSSDLALEALQGQWRLEVVGPDREAEKRLLEIVGTRARLRVIDSTGDSRCLGEAELILRSRRPGGPRNAPAVGVNPPLPASRSADPPSTRA